MMRALCLALGLLLTSCAGAAPPKPVAFALIGDVPYNRFERTWFADLMRQIVADEVDFILHVGDIKSGGGPCDDATFADRRALFDASPVPFVLVPGDNEWMDCRRMTAGRFLPLERLAALRRVFFPPRESLGQRRIELISQADVDATLPYRENLRWQHGPLTLVTLNMPGPNNFRGRAAKAPAEFVARSAANLAWLSAAFEAARTARSRAIVVAIHADPYIKAFSKGNPRPGYGGFLERLRAETLAFEGHVLLLHGDNHQHDIDQPLKTADGRGIDNFTRIESYGSPFMGWVRISLPAGDIARFEFRSRTYSPTPPGQNTP